METRRATFKVAGDQEGLQHCKIRSGTQTNLTRTFYIEFRVNLYGCKIIWESHMTGHPYSGWRCKGILPPPRCGDQTWPSFYVGMHRKLNRSWMVWNSSVTVLCFDCSRTTICNSWIYLKRKNRYCSVFSDVLWCCIGKVYALLWFMMSYYVYEWVSVPQFVLHLGRGYIVQEFFRFPGYISPSSEIKFTDIPNGLAAATKVPAVGWFQYTVFCGICDLWLMHQVPTNPPGKLCTRLFGEETTNYEYGFLGLPGYLGGKAIADPEVKKKKLNAEIANGRLAMMAIIGMFFQDGLTGSAWGDWANYTESPLRAFENELGVQAWGMFFLGSSANLVDEVWELAPVMAVSKKLLNYSNIMYPIIYEYICFPPDCPYRQLVRFILPSSQRAHPSSSLLILIINQRPVHWMFVGNTIDRHSPPIEIIGYGKSLTSNPLSSMVLLWALKPQTGFTSRLRNVCKLHCWKHQVSVDLKRQYIHRTSPDCNHVCCFTCCVVKVPIFCKTLTQLIHFDSVIPHISPIHWMDLDGNETAPVGRCFFTF